MVRLRTQRTAILLYGLLLILPTLVLGGLQWRIIEMERADEIALHPEQAPNLARRVKNAIGDRLAVLLERENERPFDHYATYVAVEEVGALPGTLVPTPLAAEQPPDGVLAWFAIERRDPTDADALAPQLFWSRHAPPELREALQWELEQATTDIDAYETSSSYEELGNRIAEASAVATTAAHLAAMRCRPGHHEEIECLKTNLPALAAIPMAVPVGAFQLRYLRQIGGPPHLFATRVVQVSSFDTDEPCLRERLRVGMIAIQGFFLDPDWYFRRLPAVVAAELLDRTEHYLPVGREACCGGRTENHAELHLVRDFPVEVLEPALEPIPGTVRLGVDLPAVEERFQRQRLRFLFLFGMLALSLGTGLWLLLKSVAKDLEQAARTENFVAAVTHELRTPLSGIKLHAEMLLDGWARDPAQQSEYHRRILRETDRLATLVERVLEKSRLGSAATHPLAADLNPIVAEIHAELALNPITEGRDLALELEDGLPQVWLTSDALRSILVNLIENARKYAPVQVDAAGDPLTEPILVRTRHAGDRVLLEVLDRGPGISPKEARRIFEAFYRIGNEATRTSRGTGLGLHLVALQAEAIGATVRAIARPGGGAIFELSLAALGPK